MFQWRLAYQAVQSNQFMFIIDHRFILNKHHISNLQKGFVLYTSVESVVHWVKEYILPYAYIDNKNTAMSERKSSIHCHCT